MADTDTDGDGLTDAQEAVLGTDPTVSDTGLFAAIRSHPHFFGLLDREGVLASAPDGVVVPREGSSPVGYFFDVATNGFGVMPSYASRIPVNDRWAIVAYIRALQYSRAATIDDVPPAERARLEAAGQ